MGKYDWLSEEQSERSKRIRADEKRWLSGQGRFTVGVPDVTDKLKLKNFPKDVSHDTVRRAFHNGDLPHEPQDDVNQPYCIHVDSYPPIDPGVDLRGIGQIAKAAGMSKRHTVRIVKDPESRFPYDKLFGRYYSCQSSVNAWQKK